MSPEAAGDFSARTWSLPPTILGCRWWTRPVNLPGQNWCCKVGEIFLGFTAWWQKLHVNDVAVDGLVATNTQAKKERHLESFGQLGPGFSWTLALQELVDLGATRFQLETFRWAPCWANATQGCDRCHHHMSYASSVSSAYQVCWNQVYTQSKVEVYIFRKYIDRLSNFRMVCLNLTCVIGVVRAC